MKLRWRGKTYLFGSKDKAAYRERQQLLADRLAKILARKKTSENPIDLPAEFYEAFSSMWGPDSAFSYNERLSARDRIIQATSVLAELLRFCITMKMIYSRGNVPSKNAMAAVFSGSKVLSSFSDRIDFCSAFGIINSDIKGELGTLKELRNEVAHSVGHWTFDDPWIASQCAKLNLKFPLDPGEYQNANEFRFVASCWMVAFGLIHTGLYLQEQQKVMNANATIVERAAAIALNNSLRAMKLPEIPVPSIPENPPREESGN